MSQSSVVPAYKEPIFKVKRPAMRYPKTLSTPNESLIQAFEAAKNPQNFHHYPDTKTAIDDMWHDD